MLYRIFFTYVEPQIRGIKSTFELNITETETLSYPFNRVRKLNVTL